MRASSAPGDFEVGDWLVEASIGRVSRSGQVLHLRPKLIDLLVFLARQDGRVVGKDVIFAAVWPDEFVVESVLARSVADLRRALGDHSGRPRIIETIPKRGYRLVAPIRWRRGDASPVSAPSIAVLPFADLAAAADQRYLCDGLAEELANSLCGVPGLRVIAHTSAFAFRDKAADARDIGRQLGVRALIEGSVQRLGDRLRVTVQLIDAVDGCHLWSGRFDRDGTDMFALEDEIARSVVNQIRAQLIPLTPSVPPRPWRGTRDAAAQELFLHGRFLSARRTPASLDEAARCFREAIRRDKAFALAHAGLAESRAVNAFMGNIAARDGFTEARAAAECAVALDGSLAEGHTALGGVAMFNDWQWEEAERRLHRALELNPSYALAHMLLSHVLAATGRAHEAFERAEIAQSLDPLSLTMRVTVGLRMLEARDYEGAIARLTAVLVTDPAFALAHFQLGRAYLVLERMDQAIAHLREAAGSSLALGFLGAALARAGRRSEALELLVQLEQGFSEKAVGAAGVAFLHQGLGDVDRAIVWHQRALDGREGPVVFYAIDPTLDALRPIPAFAALLRRLQLPA